MLVPWHLKKNTQVAKQQDHERNTVTVDGCMAATPAESSDAKNSEILHRYYHLFVEGELAWLCELVVGVRIVNNYYDQGNWCIVIERTADYEV